MYDARMGFLLSAADFSQLFSKLGLSVDNKTAMIIVYGACTAIALIAVLLAVWAVRKKSGQHAKGSNAAESGIPLKLEIYAGRCRNTSAFLNLSDCLTIGSGADCDIIFEFLYKPDRRPDLYRGSGFTAGDGPGRDAVPGP